MPELNAHQRRFVEVRHAKGIEVFVLTSGPHGCMLLVHDPDYFNVYWRVNLNRQGNVRAKFKYQLVPDLVATAA